MPESTIPGEIVSLNLPDIERVVLAGSGVLELAGIRSARDIDLVTDRKNTDFLLESDPIRWSKEVHHFRRIRDGSRFQRTSVIDDRKRYDIWQTWYHAGLPLGERQLVVDRLIENSWQHKKGFYVLNLAYKMEMKFWADREKDQSDIALYTQWAENQTDNPV